MTDNTAKFDPGIGELVEDFASYCEKVYSSIRALKSQSQKSKRFKMFAGSLLKKAENNVAFYAGCLLWAKHLSEFIPPREIEGNPFLNLNKDELEMYDYCAQTDFLSAFFDGFERDYGYYTGKSYKISELWRGIVKTYAEFLRLNNGLVNARLTSDIKLPEETKSREFCENIENEIKASIENRDLTGLLTVYNR